MLLSVGACLVFVASTNSLLCSTAIHIRHDEMIRPCRKSRGKIHQGFKNRSRGRPGNEASLHFARTVTKEEIASVTCCSV